jgi:hypothetical protein
MIVEIRYDLFLSRISTRYKFRSEILVLPEARYLVRNMEKVMMIIIITVFYDSAEHRQLSSHYTYLLFVAGFSESPCNRITTQHRYSYTVA